MLRAYEDKEYEITEMTAAFEKFERKANRHSATLVLICLNKLCEILIKVCELASNLNGRISSYLIKRIHVLCSKMYPADLVLYIAMAVPEDDLFYS